MNVPSPVIALLLLMGVTGNASNPATNSLHSNQPTVAKIPGDPDKDGYATPKSSRSLLEMERAIRGQSLDVFRRGLRENQQAIHPGTKDLDDLAIGLYVNHRIIGLGEATHGTSEIFTMKSDLFKSLVKTGARTLIMELSVTGAGYLDEYVGGKIPGSPTLPEVMKNSHFYQSWLVPELANLVHWIREFNLNHVVDPIRIYGIDNQMPDVRRILRILGAKSPGFDVKAAEARDAEFYPALGKMMSTLYPVITAVPGADADLIFENRHRFLGELRSAVSRVSLTTRERAVADLDLRALDQECDMPKDYYLAGSRMFRSWAEITKYDSANTLRDRYMAENFAFTEKNLIPEGSKVVVWAHSAHLSRRPVTDLESGATLYPLGIFLASWYGKNYHVVNVTVGGGSTRGQNEDNPENPTRRSIDFKVRPLSVEGIIASSKVKDPIFINAINVPMGSLPIDYLCIGSGLSTKDGAGVARGTLSDFDSWIFMSQGRASEDLIQK